MKFTKKQEQLLRNCHPEADDDALIEELENHYGRGADFEKMLKGLPGSLNQRSKLPWMQGDDVRFPVKTSK